MDDAPNIVECRVEPFGSSCSVDLKRIDEALNMRRYYHISLQPDLFGGVDVVREWGRIGRRGQSLIERHPDEQSAMAAMRAREAVKRKRGYGSRSSI
ncbi:MAG: WGR domain-containing protein [Maritimibacter sp.]|uniref:WGR domain-containing protein n=1 Tax=Maritimibacter sp. TaxID=2003363 RepID=UPI001D60882E|nr:WGR domain-containing protein [Maritimibacter sp.]MBL6429998.1 WGR domain-containing protein [Maritimibacter sp.]